jgi:signal transduction histidine kinase
VVCIVETEEQRSTVLRNGGHNAWLIKEKDAFPDRLSMNARMGLLQQRLVQQHSELVARIDVRTARLERALAVLKQAEAHLQIELEQSRTASRHKSEFIAHISHELRNPLNAISGFSEIMNEEMFGPLGHDRYRAHARTIHAASQHLLNIVNGLLDLAKAEAGKIELVAEEVRVQTLVQDTVELLAQQANDAGVTLNLDLDLDLPPIQSDSGKVRQILINLVSNAIKFTPAGGRVTVAARRDEDSGVMILVVTDTGIGIAPRDLEGIMQPYVQAPNSRSREAGTGLGLPITKQFVELLGGTIDVRSEVGAGTVFTIRLPQRHPASRAPRATADIEPARARAPMPARPMAHGLPSVILQHPVVRQTVETRR